MTASGDARDVSSEGRGRSSTRRRRLLRWLGILSVLAVAGIALYLRTGHLERWARERLSSALSEALGRPVAIETFRLEYLPPAVTVEGVHAEGPLLSVRRLEATLSVRALLRGRFVVKDIDLDEPVIGWQVGREHMLAPRRGAVGEEGRLTSRLSVRRVRVHRGEVRLGSSSRPFEATFEGLSLQASNTNSAWGREGLGGPWEGSLVFTKATLQFDDLVASGLAGSLSFEADAESLRARRLRLKAQGVDVRGAGILWPTETPRGRLDLTLSLEPDSPFVRRPLNQFAARHLDAEMRVTLAEKGLEVSGTFTASAPVVDLDRQEGSDGPLRAWLGREAKGSFKIDSRGIQINGAIESFAGGTLQGRYRGEVPEGAVAGDEENRRRHQVTLDARGLRLEEVLRQYDLPGDDDVTPSALVTGTATLSWTGHDLDAMTGRAALSFQETPGLLPLSGDASLTWRGRRVTIVSSDLRGPGARMDLAGTVDATAVDLGLRLEGELFADDATPLAGFLARRFGDLPGDPTGRIGARFKVEGTAARPRASASFEASELRMRLPALAGAGALGTRAPDLPDAPRVPLALSTAAGAMRYEADTLTLDLERATAEGLDLTGSLRVDTKRAVVLGIRLDVAEAPADLLARLAGPALADLEISGRVAATVRLAATPGPKAAGPMSGEVEIRSRQLEVNGIPVADLESRIEIEPGRIRLAGASLSVYGGVARGEGEVRVGEGSRPDGVIELTLSGLDLAAFGRERGGPSLAGRMDGLGRVTMGQVVAIEATLSGEGVSLAGIDLGRITGHLRGPLDRIQLEMSDATGDLSATGLLSRAQGSTLSLDGTLELRAVDLERARPLLPPGALAGLRGETRGLVTIQGPLADARSLRVRAVLDRLELTAGGESIHSEAPVTLTLEDGFLTLAPTRLKGGTTDLTVGGTMLLGGSHEITARIQGAYDLGLIELVMPEARASGAGTVDLGVIQRGDTLTYTGTIALTSGQLAHPALPLPITALQGSGVFTEEGLLRIDEIGFDMGGGNATGSGWARFEGASLPQAHLAITGRGIRAEILPELRAFFDAVVTLDKHENDYRMGGTIAIQRAIYSRPFGVAPTELLLRSREFAPARARPAGAPQLYLDLDIVADGDVWVRNKDALIEASVHLSLEGTLDRPELSGRISALEGGTYRFRDVTYRIVGGALDFNEFTRIDPEIDIQASTHVEEYEITLHVTGRFSRPIFNLTSEPTLEQRDIVWLLLTGHTLQDTPHAEATHGFAEAQVASYLAAPVAGVVAAPIEKLIGASSVQIDPFFLNGTADPSARLTVTKRVASNLMFTYSSSLGQSGQEIYQVEYNPGRLWDLIATRDFDGAVGADTRFRRRWRGAPPVPAPAPGQSAGGDGLTAIGRIRLGQIRIVADRLVGSEESLVREVKLDPGDAFRRGDLLEGRERLRQRYVEEGYPAAEVYVVEEPVDPSAPAVRDVRYVIRAGPKHELRIEADVRRRPIRRAVRDAWEEPILLEDLAGEARRAALDLLHGKGYYTARVEADIEAPEPDKRVVRMAVTAGPEVRVRSITITGSEGVPEERIRRQMLTHVDSWYSFFDRGYLKPSMLEDDLDAIRGLYHATGYLAAAVAPAEVKLSEDGSQADVLIRVEEGPRSQIEAVAIEGEVEGVPEEDLMRALSLTTSQVLRPVEVELAADRLRAELDKNGYGRARVVYRVEGTPEHARVVFSITPLDRVRVRQVTIEGNTRTHTSIVRREVQVKEGEYLERADVLATQRNLYRLGVFRSVQIESVPLPDHPGFVNVTVRLQEGSPLLTAWGVGYNTRDRARASFELANNNLFGTRRSAALFLKASAVDRRAQISLRDPNLIGERIDTLVTAFAEREEFPSYDERRGGVGLQLSRKISPRTTLFGRYRLEDVDLLNLKISEEETGLETGRLGSLAASHAYDSRDDIVQPARGILLLSDVRLYLPVLGSETAFTRLYGSAAYFRDIGRGTVWASSIRGGYLTSPAPIGERFFAGGDTTLRGFDFNQVGPEDPNTGEPIGGSGQFLFNQELRFPIHKALRGVVFYDGGNVYGEGGAHHFTNWRHVAGAGLRFDTPIGPFRVEYGLKIDREEDESAGELFFSIGQAF